jgi:hypothetical protein
MYTDGTTYNCPHGLYPTQYVETRPIIVQGTPELTKSTMGVTYQEDFICIAQTMPPYARGAHE